ncbi:hypothetical protein [Citrobacter phage Tr1]|nr:hypothetical protein [Citrobacter phage Tr1]
MFLGLNILFMVMANVFIWGFDNLAAGLVCLGGQLICLVLAVLES